MELNKNVEIMFKWNSAWFRENPQVMLLENK